MTFLNLSSGPFFLPMLEITAASKREKEREIIKMEKDVFLAPLMFHVTCHDIF